VKIRIGERVVSGGRVRTRATVMRQKTGRPVNSSCWRRLGSALRPGLNAASLRRTKASIIYRATGNLRAVQLLLGQTKIESTVRYLGVDVEDALTLAQHTEI